MDIIDRLRDDEPELHFFYELLGKRDVDQETLLQSGLELWAEAAARYGVTSLWDIAQDLVVDFGADLSFSHVEHLRQGIITGSVVPPGWKSARDFPFKGLLISALYFKEAERSLLGTERDRAWHLLVTGYYYLGLNTTESEAMAQARKLAQRNAAKTENVRLIVAAALELIIENRAPVSLTEAKELVVELLMAAEKGIAGHLLTYADRAGIDSSLPDAERQRLAMERIPSLLDLWARPTGPYPGIARLFEAARRPKSEKTADIRAEEVFEQTKLNSPPNGPKVLKLHSILEGGEVVRLHIERDDSEVSSKDA